jgi:hypothetical protein
MTEWLVLKHVHPQLRNAKVQNKCKIHIQIYKFVDLRIQADKLAMYEEGSPTTTLRSCG